MVGIAIVLVVVIMGTVAMTRRRSAALRDQFGPEYDRTLEMSGVAAFDAGGEKGKPRVGPLPISYDPNRDAAIKRALELFGWFGGDHQAAYIDWWQRDLAAAVGAGV